MITLFLKSEKSLLNRREPLKKGRLPPMAMILFFSGVKVPIFLFQLFCQFPYIAECFEDFLFIWAAAAQLELYKPATMDNLYCYPQQLQTHRINKAFAHMFWQCKPSEPVKNAVYQSMELQAVGIYGFLTAAKSKPCFPSPMKFSIRPRLQ